MKRKQFKIEHMDTLGQGVSKIEDKITFIKKVLPMETGQAIIYKEQSKIQFGIVDSLDQKNSRRQKSPCIHFSDCPSCHYLHTDYENEIEIKKKGLSFQLQSISQAPNIQVHPSKERLGYRNRIQLHYSKDQEKLGYFNSSTKQIVEVLDCLLGNTRIQKKIRDLYEDKTWFDLVAHEKNEGHIEIYDRLNGEPLLSVNKPYSFGGFTQVNQDMNLEMNELLKKKYEQYQVKNTVLDLFGGDGNLTASLKHCEVHIIDSTPSRYIKTAIHQKYNEINLYKKYALKTLTKIMTEKIDTLVIDPPRSGYRDLLKLVKILQPKAIFYISCFPSTLIRDIKSIEDFYNLQEVHLFDFFPSTYHFETLAILKKKQ